MKQKRFCSHLINNMIKKYTTKIILGLLVIVIIIFLLVYLSFFSFRSARSFGPLVLGGPTVLKIGDGTGAPYRSIWESRFYVYAIQKDMDYCALESCGAAGALVQCMEGWISADAVMAADEYGLKESDVRTGRASIIIVADKDQKIAGIYPNRTIQNVPYILKNHRDLSDRFDLCYNLEMPKRW